MSQPEMVYDGTNVETGGYIVPFKLYKKLSFRTNFTGTTETISNIVDNSLSIICFTDNVNIGLVLNYNSRLRFYSN